jgi:integrating conjugative element protein (TIGR03756 family)
VIGMFTRAIRSGMTSLALAGASTVRAIDSGTIASAALSVDCLDYRIIGVCFWLTCTPFGCDIDTSVKVQHYVPDAMVSSYSATGENPWADVRFMSPPNASAEAGGDGTTNQGHENVMAKFKNADVIGHPASVIFSEFASGFGYICPGAGMPFSPYLLSTFDTLAWRYNIPEMFFPESLIPGLREIGSRSALNLWGNVYPRGGFLHQTDDYMAAAVVAQRAGDVVTRRGQLHVYRPLIADEEDGYWPAGALLESDATTGKWQELTPTLSSSCAVFPHAQSRVQAIDGAYAWTLWRPYQCCQRAGAVFIGSVDLLE